MSIYTGFYRLQILRIRFGELTLRFFRQRDKRRERYTIPTLNMYRFIVVLCVYWWSSFIMVCDYSRTRLTIKQNNLKIVSGQSEKNEHIERQQQHSQNKKVEKKAQSDRHATRRQNAKSCTCISILGSRCLVRPLAFQWWWWCWCVDGMHLSESLSMHSITKSTHSIAKDTKHHFTFVWAFYLYKIYSIVYIKIVYCLLLLYKKKV